jgi:tetratricopeptide (TPR) repeat protein
VKVLGELANQLHFNVESQVRATDLGQAAVAMARRLGDPEALSDTLATWYQNSWRADNLDERLSVADELVGLGEKLGNSSIAAQGSLLRAYCLLELGEFCAMDEEIDRYQRYAEEIRIPSRLYWAPFVRTTRAIVSGRYAEAERWASAALDIGQRAKEVDALPLYLVQTARILHAQGRMTADWFRAGVALAPAYAWHWAPLSAHVVFAIDLGLEADARERYERLAAQDFRNVPADVGFLNTLGNLAYACCHFEDMRRARDLYPLLLPFKTRNLSHGYAYGCNGSGARYLGLLAVTLSRWGESAQHFEEAIAHNARMGARPFCALSQFEYARLLLARNAAGDRAKAAALLQTALATAIELGIAPQAAKAKAVLDAR